MSSTNPGRRRVIAALAASLLPPLVPAPVRAAASADRIVVIGAGFGGATCAKYLRQLAPAADVLLIDRRAEFLTGPFTNLVMAGLRPAPSITRRLIDTARAHGVRMLRADVVEVDPVALTVTVEHGRRIQADRIIIAPGISLRWDLIDGLDAARSDGMPHAWLGDAQVLALKARLAAVPDGGTIVIGAPSNPYRCPPGPYERASLMAWFLKATGRGRAKILIADAKDDFSKSSLFKLEWDMLYPGMIEWISRSAGGEVTRVDTGTGGVWLRGASTPVATSLASIIPAQRAGTLAATADLCDESGWCPIDPANFESRRHAGVHVIGDACAGAPIPKSAFAANSQAKLCAAAIAALLRGGAAPRAELLNTCYSLVSDDEAISVSGYYAESAGKLAVVSEGMSPLSAGTELRRLEGRQALAWYAGITADSFGSSQ